MQLDDVREMVKKIKIEFNKRLEKNSQIQNPYSDINLNSLRSDEDEM